MKLHSLIVAAALTGTALIARGADAASNWNDQCAKCHGPDGKGETKMGKKLGIADLTDPKVQEKFADADVLKIVKEGIKDKDGKLSMKPIEGLSDDDIKALVPVVRAFAKK